MFLCVSWRLLAVLMQRAGQVSGAAACTYVKTSKAAHFFCLFTLRRSRTESARGRGCLASEFVCQAVSPRGRTDARLQPRSLQMWERPGNGGATLCTEPRRVSPLTPIQGRGADGLSATLVHADLVLVYWFSAARPPNIHDFITSSERRCLIVEVFDFA